MRCSGPIKQCITPFYTVNTTRYKLQDSHKRCEDKSDQVFVVGNSCNDIALEHHQNYCSLFCTPEQLQNIPVNEISENGKCHQQCDYKCKKKCVDCGFFGCSESEECEFECSEESEIVKNISSLKTSWLSNQTDPYILDPHLCQDSCQTPGQDCEACSNEKYPRCTKDGVEVCYHPDLWCDGHPLCDKAADEPIEITACQRKLINRGKFHYDDRHIFYFENVY